MPRTAPVILSLFFIWQTPVFLGSQTDHPVDTRAIIETILNKAIEEIDLGLYPGTLLMHALSEYCLLDGNEKALARALDLFRQFDTKEIEGRGNFISYEPGGSGVAYLVWRGASSQLEAQVLAAAKKMMAVQKRSPEGLMTSRHAKDSLEQVFIDVAFAVSPFLLYAGLHLEAPEYVDFAAFETLELFRILRDKETGLVRQGRGFQGLGSISEDNWSRGAGWGAFALSLLVRDLPAGHPKRKEVEALAVDFFSAALRYQDDNGLWHQEITDPASYIETSGSGMLLFGLGILLEKGLLPVAHRADFERGIRSYLSYVAPDGSVSFTCSGCLCPGNGTKKDYVIHPWIYNDHHAFGPAVLALTQALKMGMEQLTPARSLGFHTLQASGASNPWTYVRQAGRGDIAWENDRIAFRVFGPEVRDKVGSGVDVWAKSVPHSILDKWYGLNAAGQDYHVDRGEGCDFYNMSRFRGCGGTAIWHNDRPHTAETYDHFRIRKNQNDGIEFDLQYKTWNVPGIDLMEDKKIRMQTGTNLFEVNSTFRSGRQTELTVAIGLTNYGQGVVHVDRKRGILSIWEAIHPDHGHLGSAVLVNPKQLAGFTTHEKDEYVLIRAKTNEPAVYFAGAGWEKSQHVKNQKDWLRYLRREAKKRWN